jgi:hypothetical protein
VQIAFTRKKCVLDQFLKYNRKSLLGYFNARVRREDIFKLKIGNECLCEISDGNWLSVVNLPHQETVKSTMFRDHNIHRYTWTSPDGKHITRLITS